MMFGTLLEIFEKEIRSSVSTKEGDSLLWLLSKLSCGRGIENVWRRWTWRSRLALRWVTFPGLLPTLPLGPVCSTSSCISIARWKRQLRNQTSWGRKLSNSVIWSRRRTKFWMTRRRR